MIPDCLPCKDAGEGTKCLAVAAWSRMHHDASQRQCAPNIAQPLNASQFPCSERA